jgi:acyl-CoA synthetase (AMP-forming)/AMP-acid ligase II
MELSNIVPAANLDYDEFSDFVQVLRHRAIEQPELEVYRFLAFTGGEEISLNCRELEQRVIGVAAALANRFRPGSRILLLFPPGLEYIVGFFACMYAGMIAVPAYPLEPAQIERTLPRLIGIVKDCTASAVLTTAEARDQAQSVLPEASMGDALPWMAIDEIDENPIHVRGFQIAKVDHNRPVYLQYTSGSTGTPKGVIISHRNLLHNSRQIATRFEHTTRSQGVIWLPPYHDMGLIGGILQPLFAGFPVALMSHIDFLKHPLRWLRAVSRYRATTSGGPNFAYEMLASMRIADSDLDSLDLHAWDVAFIGAEPIRAKTLSIFADRFARCGFRREAFYPCYGLAEHTLFVSGGSKQFAPRMNAAQAIGCGRPADDSLLLIVDPASGKQCDDGRVGELWAQGPSVARGYWNNPEATQATFAATVEGVEGHFLRTGDYGYRENEELFITGRLKEMMIVRGANHYPHDLEATVEELDQTIFRPGGCAIFSIEDAIDPRIVVVRELRPRYLKLAEESIDAEQQTSMDRLIGKVRSAINVRHGIVVSDIVFTPPATVPKTTSGKIQRHLCRSQFMDGSLPRVVHWRQERTLT